MKKTLLFIAAIIGAIGLQAQYFVDKDATGNNDGSSWANAFTNLDTALFYWDITTSHQEIWVAEGIYTPGDGVDRTAAFNAKANMFGGFDGTETSRGERDPKTNLTILSGDLQGNDNGNVSWAEPTRSDNSYSIIYTQSAWQINGFVIEGGHANDNASSDQYQSGAAIYHFNNGTDITNCVFRNNVGYEDAVIRFRAATGYNSDQDIHNCEFYNNQGFGSLIGATRPNNFTRSHEMRLFNNLFHNNELVSNDGSIIYANSYENAGSFNSGSFAYYIYNNTFVNNTIPVDGGTIGFGSAFNNQPYSMSSDLLMEVIGNVFWDSNDSPLVRKSRLFPNDLVDSYWFVFAGNLVKQSTPITDIDLHAGIAYSYSNVYNEYPMFTDTANLDFTITDCASPVNDIASYDVANQNIPDALFTLDFYGNERLKGMAYDAGHCEVQNEAASIDIQQVGATLEATTGFSTYTWYYLGDPNNPIPLSETSNILTPTNGDGTYTVLVEDADMCNNRADFSFCSSVTVILTFDGTSFYANGNGGNEYAWYLDGTYITNGTSLTPTTTGEYRVDHYEYDGMNVIGCTGSAYYTITCDSLPDAIISESNGTLSVDDVFDTYQWWLDGTAISGANSASYTATTDGDYEVEVVGAFNCGTVSNTYSYCAGVNITISQNGADFTATSGFSAYQWYLDGVAISGVISETYTATQDGAYSCNATDNGCTGSSNTINYVGGTGIKDIAFDQLNVYPNPTTGIVNIAVGNEDITSIRIFDLSGRMVKQYGTETQINVSDITTGIYLLEIANKEKRSIVKLIVR